jgi:soluble lytic murein transglycosylase-like protein
VDYKGRIQVIFALLLALIVAWSAVDAEAWDIQVVPTNRRYQIKRMVGHKPTTAGLERLARYSQYFDYFARCYFFGHRINKYYLMALALAESNGDPHCRGKAGELGIMQFMPETAWRTAQELSRTGADFRFIEEERLRNFQEYFRHDPAMSILMAAYLTGKYLAAYGTRLDWVVISWNRGNHFLSRFGDHDRDPRETSLLVARVNAYLRYFHSPEGRAVLQALGGHVSKERSFQQTRQEP